MHCKSCFQENSYLNSVHEKVICKGVIQHGIERFQTAGASVRGAPIRVNEVHSLQYTGQLLRANYRNASKMMS